MTTQEIALKLAPSLRDKFDFSVDEQFDEWAELSVKAAEAFKKRFEKIEEVKP